MATGSPAARQRSAWSASTGSKKMMKQAILATCVVLAIVSAVHADKWSPQQWGYRPTSDWQRLELQTALSDWADVVYAAEWPMTLLHYGPDGRYSAAWNNSIANIANFFQSDVQMNIYDPLFTAPILSFVGLETVMAFLGRPDASPRPAPVTTPRIVGFTPAAQPFSWAAPSSSFCNVDNVAYLAFDYQPVFFWAPGTNGVSFVAIQNQQITLTRKCVNNQLEAHYKMSVMNFSNVPLKT